MISEGARRYCSEDISRIENYELAKNDLSQTWHCHHRMETGEHKTKQQLVDEDRYYSRPASELVFLTKKEHYKLHNPVDLEFLEKLLAAEETVDDADLEDLVPLDGMSLQESRKDNYAQMARKHTLKLTPYPSVLVLSLDQTPFQKGEYKDAIGLTTKSGSWLQININLENDKATQAGAVVHESAHAVQMLEEVVSTKFDMETFAYMVQHIATWTLEKLGLLPS